MEEERRLAEPPGHGLEEVGAVPERAPVGHGARGLQPGRRRLGLLPARPRPQPGLPLGRGRHRRALRRAAAALPGAGAVERPRPDPQGAPVRPDQRRGQSRRGRQGALLLPRRHADALLPEDALQVPAARVSRTRSWSRRTAAAASDEPEFELLDTGVFDDDRYFDVFVEYAKAGAERHPDADHRPQPRPGGAPTCTCCRSSGSATPGRGASPAVEAGAGRSTARRRGRGASATRLGAYHLYRRRRRAVALHATTRPTRGGCSAQPTPTGYFKDAFHEYVVARQRRRRQPAAARHEGRGALPARRPRGRSARSCACGCPPTRRPPPFADFDDDRRPPPATRPTSSTPTCRTASPTGRAARAAAGARRHDLEQAVLSTTTCRKWLDGDPGQPPPPPERRHGRNREWRHLNNADVISMPDKWEYPWYAAWDLAFHCIAARAGRSRVRQGAARAADARVVHAPERPAAGLRVGVRRRESAGARLGGVARLPDRPQAAPAKPDDPGDLAFLERVFHKLMLNFTWWVNRKDAAGPQHLPGRLPRARQHRRLRPQRAAADRRLHRPGRRHRAGWRCTA